MIAEVWFLCCLIAAIYIPFLLWVTEVPSVEEASLARSVWQVNIAKAISEGRKDLRSSLSLRGRP